MPANSAKKAMEIKFRALTISRPKANDIAIPAAGQAATARAIRR
jgi:hypothetical protein